MTLGKSCALIAIVGAAPQKHLSEIFSALKASGAEIICADTGSGDGGVTIGVGENMLASAIRALYENLIR